jgi:hypothetical protein
MAWYLVKHRDKFTFYLFTKTLCIVHWGHVERHASIIRVYLSPLFSVQITFSQHKYTKSMAQSPSWGADNRNLVKKFSATYESRKFITVFAMAHNWTQFWAT